MSWLRLDDKFVRHPKITRLVRGDRWTWLEVLCYCAEYHTDGWVPDTIREVVPKATGPFLEHCYQVALLDIPGDNHESAVYRVHDWDRYNSKDHMNAERQARWRRKRNAESNAKVTDGVTPGVTSSRAGTRARPPTPKEQEPYERTMSREDPAQPQPDPEPKIDWSTILKPIPD